MRLITFNIFMTIQIVLSTYTSTINALIGIFLIMFTAIIWFSIIAYLHGYEKSIKSVQKKAEAFIRLYERYKSGEIREINEQTLDQELSLNKFYR